MTTIQELRNLAFEARKENSVGRLERYTRARDEAFGVITDGSLDAITTAAKEGRFRHSVYSWVQTRRTDTTTEEDTSVQQVFGNDENGEGGLPIRVLMEPRGIDYQETLIAKLRAYFNEHIGSGEQTEGRQQQIRVFLDRRPTNPRQFSIVVSWDSRPVNRGTRFVAQGQQQPRSYGNRTTTTTYQGRGGQTRTQGRGGVFRQ